MKSDLIDITVQLPHETDRAVCVRETEDGPDIWLPLSQCEIAPCEADLLGGLARGRVAILAGQNEHHGPYSTGWSKVTVTSEEVKG